MPSGASGSAISIAVWPPLYGSANSRAPFAFAVATWTRSCIVGTSWAARRAA